MKTVFICNTPHRDAPLLGLETAPRAWWEPPIAGRVSLRTSEMEGKVVCTRESRSIVEIYIPSAFLGQCEIREYEPVAVGAAPPPPTAPQILEAAAGHMQDRAATYDKPGGERSMAATVDAFNIITGHTLTEEQGWLFMGVLKKVRSQQGAYRADNYEDDAAYAALRGEAASRERGDA